MVNAINLVEENIKGLEKLTEEHLEKFAKQFTLDTWEIGRASCRERV